VYDRGRARQRGLVIFFRRLTRHRIGAIGNVTVLVGARPYHLTEQEARRLAQHLRGLADEEADADAVALRLGWALALMVNEDLDEPLEIGRPQAEAVIHALPEVTAPHMTAWTFCCGQAKRLADAPSE
jgi:hypothetical protein